MKKIKIFISMSLIFLLIGGLFISENTYAASKDSIIHTAASISMYANQKNKAEFLKCIDKSNSSFYAEETHWFDDGLKSVIKDFSMKISYVKEPIGKVTIAGVKQTYKVGNIAKEIEYEAVFIKKGFTYKFSDINFESLETKYFKIKYMPALKYKAMQFSKYIDDSMDIVKKYYGYVTNNKVEVKLYDNNDILSSSIKPSFTSNLGGWHEYGESIKLNWSNMNIESIKDRASADKYVRGLAHELTHYITVEETKNNIPYWIAEGIATYVQNKDVSLQVNKPTIKLSELENKDLERYDSNYSAGDYYKDACSYVALFLSRYGNEKFHRLISEMGKYPVSSKNSEDLIKRNNDIFHEILKGQMNLKIEDLDKILTEGIKQNTARKKPLLFSQVKKALSEETMNKAREVSAEENLKLNYDEMEYINIDGINFLFNNYKPLNTLEEVKKYYQYMSFPSLIDRFAFQSMNAIENRIYMFDEATNTGYVSGKVYKRDLSKENILNVVLNYINNDKKLTIEVDYCTDTVEFFTELADKKVTEEKITGKDEMYKLKNKESGTFIGIKKNVEIEGCRYQIGFFIRNSNNNELKGIEEECTAIADSIDGKDFTCNLGI